MKVWHAARAGHWPSLLGAFLHFETSFATWVLLGVLAPIIALDFRLSPSAKGLLVGTPLLSAAIFRVLAGWLVDVHGPRRIGTATMVLALVPLTWGWLGADGFGSLLAVGVLLGVAGASVAIALPLAAGQYPPAHHGLALGIAGAGNSGTIIAALLAPRIAERIGWHATLGLAALPVAAVAAAFWLLARDPPVRAATGGFRARLAPARERNCWRLCGLYAVTFGGYVGLASFLPVLLVDRYGVSRVAAGTLTAAAAGLGSILRPVGGLLADRIGGTKVLVGVFGAAALLAVALSAAPVLVPAVVLTIVLLGTLGIGNGAVFQLVPSRFPGAVGVATGLIGAAGGIGGFLLPSLLGAGRQITGAYGAGLWIFAAAALVAWAPLAGIHRPLASQPEPALAEAV